MPRHRLKLTALAACALLAACGGQTTPAPPTQGSASSAPPVSAAPSQAPASAATYVPLPSALPSGPAPSASLANDASTCSGSHDNRTFFEEIAAQVPWDVYCAVLPSGWFVRTGSFSLRDGGKLEITYSGPQGATFSLKEGSFCTQGGAACAPQDAILGSTAFGDRTGQLVSVGGGFAVYVDPGGDPSWEADGGGLDQATFVTLVAALHKVAPGG